MKIIKCPFCGFPHTVTHYDLEQLEEVGKSVIDCEFCFQWYVLRDEGDGIYANSSGVDD